MKKKVFAALFAAAVALQTISGPVLAQEAEGVLESVTDEQEAEGTAESVTDEQEAEGTAEPAADEQETGKILVDEENFQEVTLFENEACVLRLTGIEPDFEWGYAWDILYENKLDEEVMFSFSYGSVNGYMTGVSREGYDNVPGGGKLEDRLVFEQISMDENQIDEIAEAEVNLFVASYEAYNVLVNDKIAVSYAGREAEKKDEASIREGETVLAQSDDYLMKIKETFSDEENGYGWRIYLENDSDKDIQFLLENVTVNGFVCDPCWGSAVCAGKRSNEEIGWYPYSLEKNGITQITEIEGMLRIVSGFEDADSYRQEMVPIHLYPLGEDAVQPFVRTPVEGEYTVADNDYCTAIVTGQKEEEYGFTIEVYIENKTDQTLEFVLDSTTVNGTALEGGWGVLITDIPAGKRCNAEAYWSKSDLETGKIANVSEIKDMDAMLNVYDYDNWENIFQEKITLLGGDAGSE